jgi:transcription antitermination factor NusG
MKNWFVVNTKPKKELQVERIFSEAGFAVYCPKYAAERGVRPFFPGYCFLFFDHPAELRLVSYTRGVKKVVGNREGAIAIPVEAVEAIRGREKAGLIELEKYGAAPRVGDEIVVAEGPLRGLKGVFRRETGERERVMILLNYVSYQGQLLIEKRKVRRVDNGRRVG